MRQIFNSPRLENVESVAKLLNDAGIETYVSERRSYKGNRRRTFSYKEDSGDNPGVWIINADDLTRARELMRDAGLLETTKPGTFLRDLPESPYRNRDPSRTAKRLRLVLLGGVVLAATVSVLRTCNREKPIDERHIVPVYTTPP
jgi:hypothetical protein